MCRRDCQSQRQVKNPAESFILSRTNYIVQCYFNQLLRVIIHLYFLEQWQQDGCEFDSEALHLCTVLSTELLFLFWGKRKTFISVVKMHMMHWQRYSLNNMKHCHRYFFSHFHIFCLVHFLASLSNIRAQKVTYVELSKM